MPGDDVSSLGHSSAVTSLPDKVLMKPENFSSFSIQLHYFSTRDLSSALQKHLNDRARPERLFDGTFMPKAKGDTLPYVYS